MLPRIHFVCAGKVCKNLTKDASQRKSASAHPFNQPNAQQSKQKICERCYSHQPDGQLVILYSRHLQNGGAVVPKYRVQRKHKLPGAFQDMSGSFLRIDSVLIKKQVYNHIAFWVSFLTNTNSMLVCIFEHSKTFQLLLHL